MPDHPTTRCAVLDEAALLVPGLVHELRQPVMGIKAALALLGRDLGEALTGLDDWQLVVGQLARLEEVLDTYRELIQLAPVDPLPFEPAPVVLRGVSLLRFRTRKLGPRFTVSIPGDLPVVLGAPSALLHSVTNVLVNALDAVEGMGERGRVEVRMLTTADAPGRVQLRVSDNGCGVAPAIRDRLFEPLFTTKPSGQGTGLGLYTARRMLDAFGGMVRLLAEDAPQRLPWASTEFSVELPVAPGEAP